MEEDRECPGCGEVVDNAYLYCPFCGFELLVKHRCKADNDVTIMYPSGYIYCPLCGGCLRDNDSSFGN